MARMREPNAREPVWYLCVDKMHQIYQLNRAWGPNDTLLTCILHTSSKAIPEGSAQRGTQRVCRHVIGFIRSPVVGCKRPCQSHLTQSSDKVCTPEEQEDVVELKEDQIFVIWRFPTIESKQALRPRTVCLHSRESEVLEESEKWQTGIIHFGTVLHIHSKTNFMYNVCNILTLWLCMNMYSRTSGSHVCLACGQAVSLKTL